MSQNYFILHGHFYQPPRENPWSSCIDRQISASPFSDWNARIHQECYAACAYAPVLENNKLIEVTNCYEYLSFNFGPTLLEWIEREHPQTLKRIIEADHISAARCFGHGNAIAQVFNHMIMPLASEKDQYTQALWGLADFRRRFGRESEGLWLGETAINDAVAAVLVDCGVKYVILSPYQARSIIENGQEIDVQGARLDTGRAYRLPTKNGDLAVFFYDGPMASGISFGNLLQDASCLEEAVNSAFSARNGSVRLVHTATDGEVYGHHKALGNMALARFINKNTYKTAPEFTFTNYGAFLEEHPPLIECSIIPGKDGKGSAWSCAHGVGRWHEDCSCHTGGLDSWNQKWRTPLRDAFDLLRDEIYKAAEKELSPLLKDVWKARNEYYTPYALKTEEAFEAFFIKHQKGSLSIESRRKIAALMEGLRFAMLMYTSCGWFFSDISGIETIQDLLYARRAYEYFQAYIPSSVYEKYLALLAEAKSNIPSQGTGKDILIKSYAETQISEQTLRHYLALQAARSGELVPHPSYSTEFLYHDAQKALIKFSSFCASDIYAAYVVDERSLLYTEFSSEPVLDEKFWLSSASWHCLEVSSLPAFLRLQALAHSIAYEIKQGYNNSRAEVSMPSAAFFGIDKYLLPDEASYISIFLNLRIAVFACKSGILSPQEMDVFQKSIILYKQCTRSKEDLEFLTKFIIAALLPLLKRSIKAKEAALLKSVRVILWEIKEYISSASLIRLQDAAYRAYLAGAGRGGGSFPPEFHTEFQSLKENLNFSTD